ncbi:8058_t:CDS:2 [Paraglomus brasilianum]|uniref:8058_t:CDS:1 n=1 Tax=Paraglomus brasilianum TaxID=144538 RepID=A0A9N9FJ98_9GLOM|nr:8058_t:CDS:2 [Paraglomus brasilianum]
MPRKSKKCRLLKPIPPSISKLTPTLEDMEDWDASDLLMYLRNRHESLKLDEDDLKTVERTRMTGDAFLKVHIGKLREFGLAYGSAKKIEKEIERLHVFNGSRVRTGLINKTGWMEAPQGKQQDLEYS